MLHLRKKLFNLSILIFIPFVLFAQKDVTQDVLSFEHLERYIKNDSLPIATSLHYAKRYIRKAKAFGQPTKIIDGYYFAGLLSSDKEKIMYADSILGLSGQALNYRIEDAYVFKGGEFYKKAIYQEALDYYLKALEYVKQSGDKQKLFFLEYNIGTLQSITGEYRKSLDKFLKSFAYINAQKEEKKAIYLTVVSALATTYQKLGVLDSASYYATMGIRESRNNPSLLNKYKVLVLKEGITQFYKKNYGNARDSIQKTIPYLQKVKDTGNLAYAYFYKGKIFDIERNEEKALEQFKKLDTIFVKSPVFFPESREAYEMLIQYYRNKNDLEKQLHYTERLLTMDSTMYHKNTYVSKKITEAYDTPRLLEDKEQLIKTLARKGSLYKYVLLLSLFLIAIISVLLLVYYKKQKRYKENFEALLKKNKTAVSSSAEISSNHSLDHNIPKEIVERVLERLDHFKRTQGFLSSNLTLHQLAKKLKTNHSYLSKIINVFENKSFSTFLNELRIDYTIERLQTDTVFIKYTIDAIAEESGFSNTRSFTRAFQRKTNINPSYFIKNLKQQ